MAERQSLADLYMREREDSQNPRRRVALDASRPAWEALAEADVPADEILLEQNRVADAQARAEAAQRGRDTSDARTLGGIGFVTRPLVNTITDPDRRQSVADAAVDAGTFLFRDVALPIAFGQAPWLPSDQEVIQSVSPGNIQRNAQQAVSRENVEAIPGRIGQATQATGNALTGAYDWISGQADPEAFPEGDFVGGVGTLARDYGPDLARAVTYGPWEDERNAQRQLDEQRALGNEEETNALADEANLQTLWAGANAAFAPADVPALIGGLRAVNPLGGAIGRGAARSVAERSAEGTPRAFEGAPQPQGRTVDARSAPTASPAELIARQAEIEATRGDIMPMDDLIRAGVNGDADGVANGLGDFAANGARQRMPLIEQAGAIGTPLAAAGGTGALLYANDANAEDGSGEGDDWVLGGDATVPILGGVTAGTIAALTRGRLGRNSRSQVGMFAGVNARTADRAALARAEELAASGASRDEIWSETGWFQGVDGKWRFEIDDSGATIAPDMLERHSRASVGGSQRRPLSEGLQHPELDAAYDLSDTSLDFGRLSRGAVGEYDNARRSISMYAADDPDMLRSGTLHETQHRVQREEGFATGGTPENAWGVNEQASLDAIRAQQKAVLGGRDPYAIQNRIAAGYRVADEDMAALEQWRALTRQEDEVLANTLSPREAYRRLGGETEARNVQTRRDFTPEQRREQPPWMTQDVPDDQQIIRFDGGRAESRGDDFPDFGALPEGSGAIGRSGPDAGPVQGERLPDGYRIDERGNMTYTRPEGPPSRLYHGTTAEVDEFAPGSHFGTAEAANRRLADNAPNAEGARVYAVDAPQGNYVRVTDAGDAWNRADYWLEMARNRSPRNDAEANLFNAIRRDQDLRGLRDEALYARLDQHFRDNGFSGAIYANRWEGGESVFLPGRLSPRTAPDGGPAQAGIRATQEPMHPAFEGMSREEFLGDPRITTNRNAADLKPKALTTVADQPAQPFMGRYQVRMSEDGAAVYDGDNVIASYNFGDTLVVDRAHRRQGIAQELVYQWRTRYPGPAVARERTRASQAIQEQVWERIKNHPGDGGNSGGGRNGPNARSPADGGPVQAGFNLEVGGRGERTYTAPLNDSFDLQVMVGAASERSVVHWGVVPKRNSASTERLNEAARSRLATRSMRAIERILESDASQFQPRAYHFLPRAEQRPVIEAIARRLREAGYTPNHPNEFAMQFDRNAPNAGSDRNALQRALRDRMERE